MGIFKKRSRQVSLEDLRKKEFSKKLEKNEINKNDHKEMESIEVKDLLKHLRNETLKMLIRIVNSPNKLTKIYLLILFITATTFSSYLVINSILSYLEYPVLSTTRTLYERPSVFPKITICNVNQFTTKESIDFLKQVNKEYNSSIDIFNAEHLKNLTFAQKQDLFGNIILNANYKMNSNNLTVADKKKFAHGMKDMLIGCKFNYKKCTKSDFYWIFDPNFGNCYVFNSGQDGNGTGTIPLKISAIGGYWFGLQIQLYVNFHENLTLYNAFAAGLGFNVMVVGGLGALVKIENNSYLTDETNYHGVQVSPGFQTNIVLSRAFRLKLPKPYSDCDIDNDSSKSFNNNEFFKLFAETNYQYSQSACLDICYQKLSINICNCTDPTSLSLYDTANCQGQEQYSCNWEVYNNFTNPNGTEYSYCINLCPLECNQTEYKTTSISTVNLIGEYYVDFIKQNKNLSADFVTKTLDSKTAANSVVSINIYYDSLSYDLTTESPAISAIDLFAEIGGQLSLLLGLSLFTFCEIIEIFIEVFYIKKKMLNF